MALGNCPNVYKAFFEGRNAHKGRYSSDTSCYIYETYGGELRVFGNMVAYTTAHGSLRVTLAGWPSKTTQAVLRGIGVPIFKKDGTVYITPKGYRKPRQMLNWEWYEVPMVKP